MKVLAVFAAVALTLHGAVTFASEQSKRLSARGLVDLHAERYDDALQLFEGAVQADPTDSYALYYRGITKGRLGDLKGAVADLRLVVARQEPGLEQAVLDLGVALVQMGAYREAVPWLQQAARTPDLGAQASLFLGMAELRLDDTARARRHLERAAALDPTLRPAAGYYLGVADFRDGQWTDAERRFSALASTQPHSELGRQAQAFLAQIRGIAHRPLQLYASAGFQYDSNVVLAPSSGALDTELRISRQGDGRAVLNAGAIATPWHGTWGDFSVGYDFYQSLHFHLTDFNLQDHRPSAQLTLDAGPVLLGLLGRYDYYFLSTDSFLQEGNGIPWLAIPEARVGRTEVFYRVRRRDFLQRAFRIRDALNQGGGARQSFYLAGPERYLFVGYAFDREAPVHDDPTSQSFGYNGNQVDAGVSWAFPAGVNAEASYSYRHENYFSQSNGRVDDDHQVVLALRKQVTAYVDVVAAYFGTVDNSNQGLFDYTRHIGSLSLEARY